MRLSEPLDKQATLPAGIPVTWTSLWYLAVDECGRYLEAGHDWKGYLFGMYLMYRLVESRRDTSQALTMSNELPPTSR